MSDPSSPLPSAPNRPGKTATYPNGRRPRIGSQGDVATGIMDQTPNGASAGPSANPNMPNRLGQYRLIKPLGRPRRPGDGPPPGFPLPPPPGAPGGPQLGPRPRP